MNVEVLRVAKPSDGWRLTSLIAVGVLFVSAAQFVAAGSPDTRATALIAELGLKASPTAVRDLPGWKAPTRIVVARASAEQLQQLRTAAPGIELLAAAEGDALTKQLAGAQGVIGLCDAATLDAAKQLHWIQALSVGVERCVVVPGLIERGIVLTNMQRTSGVPIAEHALAMTMALARGLPKFGRSQQAGKWHSEDLGRMRELTGRTLLVVGVGGIGTEVARRAHGIGMRVIGIRNSSREGPAFISKVGLPDELHSFASEADVVVNAVPLTPQTTGIYNAKFFAAMKPGGYFISVGRGLSTHSEDLLAALRSGQLAGAGLDVTDPEPLPEGHPLWKMDQVIITPHVAAESDAQVQRYWILISENLRRYVAGEALLNVVDVQRGY